MKFTDGGLEQDAMQTNPLVHSLEYSTEDQWH